MQCTSHVATVGNWLVCVQAADILRDFKTIASLNRRLLLAILGDHAYEDKFLSWEPYMAPPPSAAECAQAYQVRLPEPVLPVNVAAMRLGLYTHVRQC